MSQCPGLAFGARLPLRQALQLFAHLPLPPPVDDGGDGAQHALADGGVLAEDKRQEEDSFLNVRSGVQEVHDMRDACTFSPHACGWTGGEKRENQLFSESFS